MHVGVCRLTLQLAESHSLKAKRQVVRSLVDRLRRRFNAAVAEVEEQDTWQAAVIGIAVVSNQAAHADHQIATIVQEIEASRLDAMVVDQQVEIIPL
jgi:uncharacterized protein YlxP (DUF503 family)